MSLPLDHPFVEVGDALAQFTGWRVSGLTDRNSSRGRLYPSADPSGADVQLSVYRDRERTELVAQGTGAVQGRVTATEANSSGLEVSAIISENTQSSVVGLFASLATFDDLRARDDRLREFLLRDPPEADFREVELATLRQFYLRIQADFPPPVGVGDPLAFPGTASIVEQGRRGIPEVYAYYLWSLNTEGDWELVGLENPGDFREWAILHSLAVIWERRARSREDPVLERAMLYHEQARSAWSLVPVLVDVDLDSLPERPVKRRTRYLERG